MSEETAPYGSATTWDGKPLTMLTLLEKYEVICRHPSFESQRRNKDGLVFFKFSYEEDGKEMWRTIPYGTFPEGILAEYDRLIEERRSHA